jgi:DNA-binding HxlR family transcriptional regulator
MAAERDVVHDPRECDGALARAFGFLGKRWNGVILAVLLAGPAGFAELKRAVHGISDSVLADRLTELSRAGLVDRSVNEGPPLSVSYALTPAGNALLPVLDGLAKWAAENLPA